MKRCNILWCNFSVLRERRIGRNDIVAATEYGGTRLRLRKVSVSMSESLDDPACSDVDENCVVIGCSGEIQHAGDRHLEWIDTCDIEYGLGRRYY